MFTHIMIGSNDLERARIFYDATFTALGGKPGEMDARGRLIYVHEGGRLMVTTPIDGKPATVANGGTIGIAAASPDHVLAWHEAGVTCGGTSIESPPAERPNGVFVAYLRDPDGHKLTARTQPSRLIYMI
ncbi:VOC family protein [Agrobacterium vitis]|uniref:VOC family protein n=1 Tax=Agrobacterium vitis TaxID=373 RepID=UPI0012E98B20|nr:VOC family protein [Agrobacterium vitis]MVA37776.1 VOC family protein [Agrobacterium vitis]